MLVTPTVLGAGLAERQRHDHRKMGYFISLYGTPERPRASLPVPSPVPHTQLSRKRLQGVLKGTVQIKTNTVQKQCKQKQTQGKNSLIRQASMGTTHGRDIGIIKTGI